MGSWSFQLKSFLSYGFRIMISCLGRISGKVLPGFQYPSIPFWLLFVGPSFPRALVYFFETFFNPRTPLSFLTGSCSRCVCGYASLPFVPLEKLQIAFPSCCVCWPHLWPDWSRRSPLLSGASVLTEAVLGNESDWSFFLPLRDPLSHTQ